MKKRKSLLVSLLIVSMVSTMLPGNVLASEGMPAENVSAEASPAVVESAPQEAAPVNEAAPAVTDPVPTAEQPAANSDSINTAPAPAAPAAPAETSAEAGSPSADANTEQHDSPPADTAQPADPAADNTQPADPAAAADNTQPADPAFAEGTAPTDGERPAEETKPEGESAEASSEEKKETEENKDTEENKEEKEEEKPATKAEYVYEDSTVKVTAYLSDPAAISDTARLIVTPVTSQTPGYNYNVYMAALNEGTDYVYDDTNTFLYDYAFIENGEELQPMTGEVTVVSEFRYPIFTDYIGAQSAADVSLIHMPLMGAAASYPTTKDAVNIQTTDIGRVGVDPAFMGVDLAANRLTFRTSSFSVWALVNDTAAQNTESGSGEIEWVEQEEDTTEEDASQEDDSGEVEDGQEEQEVRTRTQYDARSGGMIVTATLADPAAIPDDAELVVTPVTQETPGYNYDAYMNALNEGTSQGDLHNETNTMLFDIAFMKDGIELQPEEGSVSVSVRFVDESLANAIGAEQSSDVTVTHLPLVEEVKEAYNTTQDATAIDASSIVVEDVAANVALGQVQDVVSFAVDSFSMFAVSYTVDFTYDGFTYSIQGEDSILLSELFSILGIEENAANAVAVEFTNTELVSLEQQEADWLLTSLQPFSTEETLTVTMRSGAKYVVEVTDAQSVRIDFYDTDGTTPVNGNLDGFNYVVVNNGNSISEVHGISVNGTSAEVPINTSAGSSVTLIKWNGAETPDAQTISNKWYYDAEGKLIDKKELSNNASVGAFSISQIGDGVYKAVKQLTYDVEIVFSDGTASDLGSNYSVYASVLANNQSGNSVTYYSRKDNITLDGTVSQLLSFGEFNRSNDNPNSVKYGAGDTVTVFLGKNIQVEQNGDNRGTITSGDLIEDGNVINGFLVTVTTEDNKTIYTFSKPEPYKYTITEAEGNSIQLDTAYRNNWYLLSTLKKANGGTYYYVTPVALNGVSAIPETGMNNIPVYYTADRNHMNGIQIGNESANNYNSGNTGTSVYQDGDTVTNELVHVSEQASTYNQIVTGDNNSLESFGNGSVANKYLVASTSENGVGSIVLTIVPEFKVQTEFQDVSKSVITDTSSLPTDYKLLIKMVRDGHTYYALHTVDNSAANPSAESSPITFLEYSNNTLGAVPNYYSGNGTETISTQVVTGTDDLLDAITKGTADGVVHYNENTIGGTQSSDLTKDLYSTASIIDKASNVMKTTFVKQKDDGVDHDIIVSFYKEHKADISQGELNPSAANMDASTNNAYFFRVRLYNNGKVVAYKIVPVTTEEAAAANSTGRFMHTIAANEEFQLVDDEGINIPDGKLYYDPTVYSSNVRFYKANTAGDLPENLQEVSAKGTDTLEGYDFWKNVYSETKDGDTITRTETDLALYSAYKKKYQVQIVIDGTDSPTTADALKIFVEAAHKTTNVDIFEVQDIAQGVDYRTETTEDGKTIITYFIEDQTTNPITKHWTSQGISSNTITGNETFNLLLKQGDLELIGGYPARVGNNHYEVSYDTGNVEGTNTIVDDTNKVTTITHFINLTILELEQAITPDEILGEAAEFGIVAERYKQDGHSETNYAVKYLDHNANSTIYGSGTGYMPFYVSTVESVTLDIDDTACPIDLYIPADQDNKLHLHIQQLKDKTFTEPPEIAGEKKLTEINLSHQEIENYVDSLISYGKQMSVTMAGKSTIAPVLSGNNKTVDTTMFPDGKTIYVDCTDCASVIGTSGWIINKLPNQSIVFNIPGENVKIGEFTVNVYNEDGSFVESSGSTTDAMDDGTSEKNRKVDRIVFDHISFNAHEAKTLDLNNASALFLAPEAEKVTQSNGAGWILAKGTVDSKSEWHFYRHTRSYRAKGDFALKGEKKIINSEEDVQDYSEFNSLTFSFELYRCDEFGYIADGARPIETVTARTDDGVFEFNKLKYTQTDVPEDTTKYFYYVIKEVIPSEVNDKGVTYDAAPIYIKVEATDTEEIINFHIYKKVENDWIEINNTGVGEDKVYEIGDFINHVDDYDATGSLTLSGAKTITNRPAGMDLSGFKFTVKKGEETVATGASAADGTITFTAINYTLSDAGKTYTYVVSEDSDSKPGVTNTTETKTVKVTVTDDGEGHLTAKATNDSPAAIDAVNFTNAYDATGSLTLSGAKTITNKPASMDLSGFKFTVKKGDETVATGTSAADGTITFTAINYTLADAGETYTYVVSEDSDSKPGVTNTTETKTVKVTVTDDGEGHLTATATDDSPAAINAVNFTNIYDANGSLTLSGAKTITNKPASMDLSGFKFTVKKGEETVATGTSAADGTITFTAINYTLADAGETYTYVVSEDSDSKPGVTNTTETKTVKVTVTDDGEGHLTATVTDDSPAAINAVNFTNTYDANGSLTLSGAKTITNKPASMDLSGFKFTVKKGDETVATGTSAEDGTITFTAINYTLADAGKTYTYVVSEDSKSKPGVTNTTTTKEVKVTVTDDGEGHLTAKATNDSPAAINAMNFTNAYDATGSLTLIGKKTITNKPASMDLSGFKFTVKKGDETVATGTSAADGTITFTAINYTLADAGETYTYVVSEDSDSKPGVTNTTETKTVKVTVTDDGEGHLTATATDDSPAAINAVNFTNTYSASGTASLTGHKDLIGDGITLQDKQFTFAVTPDEKNPADGIDVSAFNMTAANNAAGNIDFGTLTFTKEGTWKYTVRETSQPGKGVTVDLSQYEVVFDAVDNGDSTMIVNKTITKIVDSSGQEIPAVNDTETDDNENKEDPAETEEITISFTNNYAASGKAELKATKEFTDWDRFEDLEFTFKLTAGSNTAGVERNPMPNDSVLPEGKTAFEKTKTVSRTEQTALFGEMLFEKAGVYNYTIQEEIPADADENGKLNGIQYDTRVHNVQITVADVDHNGTFTIETKYDDTVQDALTVTNTYAAQGTSELAVTKVFNVWDNMPKDGFEFTLTAGTKTGTETVSPMPEGSETGEDKTVTKKAYALNAAEPAKFGTITYTEAGEYTYTIAETIPEGAETKDRGKTYVKDGITYDGVLHNVVVTVEDTKHTGEFDVTVAYDTADTSLTVTNTYAAEGEAQFEVSKELTGANLEKGQFEFKLEAKDGAPMPKKTVAANDVDGKALFDKIRYSLADMKTETKAESGDTKVSYKEKTFTYTIKEVIPDGAKTTDGGKTYTKNGITYDGHTVTVTVKATDNGDGTIKTEVSYKGEVKFINGYNAEGSIKLDASKHFTEGNMDSRTYNFEIYEAVDRDGEFIIGDNPKLIAEGSTAKTSATDSAVAFKYLDKESEKPVFTQENLRFTNEDLKVTAEDGTVTYETEKTFDYIICEKAPDDAVAMIDGKEVAYKNADAAQRSKYTFIGAKGSEYQNVSFDNNRIVVHVKVTDNGDGTLKVETVDKDGKAAKVVVEFTNTWDKAKLKMTKTITEYADGEAVNAVFNFEITGKLEDGSTYEDSRSIHYNAATQAAQTIEIDVPYGITDLTVVEVYSGNYEPDQKTKKAVQEGKAEDGSPLYTVSYVNTLKRHRTSKSIINKYGSSDGSVTNVTIQERVGLND